MKKALKLIVGIAVTVVAFYFTVKTLYKIDWNAVSKLSFNIYFIIIGAVFYSLSLVLRSLMFSRGVARDMTFIEGVRVDFIGAAANMVLPLKLGEGVRLTSFPKRYSAPQRGKLLGLTFATDIVCIIIFSFFTVIFSSFANTYYKREIIKYTVVLLIIMAAVFLLFLTIKKFRIHITTFIKDEANGTLLYGLISWFCIYLSIYFGVIALGVDFMPALKLSLLVLTATNLAFIIPSSPGAIGLFEYSVLLAFTQAGFSNSQGFAAGLLLHIMQYAATLPFGLYFYLEGLKRNHVDTDKSQQYN